MVYLLCTILEYDLCCFQIAGLFCPTRETEKMSATVDLEYCEILIKKLISPEKIPADLRNCLVRELTEAVRHQEMKDLVQEFANQDLSLEEKNNLKERFMNFDHEANQDPSEVNYKELLDKLLDPTLPDSEYKPTLKALLEGDLEQEKKKMVSAIINCQNKDQKANMVKRFKSYFDREREEAERAKRAKTEAKAAKKAARAKMEENLLKFEDDGLTLINKLVDVNIPVHLKSKVYERLMEQDIQAEIKNLAINLLEPENAPRKVQMLEDFKKERELEKIEAAKRKEQEEKQRAEAEIKRKLQKQQQNEEKQKKLQKKNRDTEMRKDKRLSAVPGPSNAKVVVREDGLSLEERKRLKKHKNREKDRRMDERLNSGSGLRIANVIERGTKADGMNSKQQTQPTEEREEKKSKKKIREKEISKDERLAEEIKRRKLKKQQKREQKQKNREMDVRRDERLSVVSGPSNKEDRGNREERKNLEEERQRKMLKKEQKQKEKIREKEIMKDERPEEELKRKMLKKQPKPEQKQDLRRDEKQNAKPGPSNAKVEERGPKDEGLSPKQQNQTEKQQKKIREKESRKEERQIAVPGPSNAKVVEREEKGDREEREEREDGPSWIVWDFDLACLDDFKIFVPDLKSSLDPSQQEQFQRDFAALEKRSKADDKKNTEKLKSFDEDRDDEGPQRKKRKKNKERED